MKVPRVRLARPRRRLELTADPVYIKCRQRVIEFLTRGTGRRCCRPPN